VRLQHAPTEGLRCRATADMGKAFLEMKAADAVEQIRKVTTATK